MINDPIGDFLARIKNAAMAGKKSLLVPHSKIKEDIAKLLEKQGYVENVEVKGKKVKKKIGLDIVYGDDDKPKIKGVSRISKLSRRRYLGYRDIRPVKFGHGFTVLSTPEGLLVDNEARKKKVGGEALFKVW